MPKQLKVIAIDPGKCTGCHSCEMACAIMHTGKCSTYLSNIRIHEFRDVNTFVPVSCMACEDAVCMKVCPMDARVRLLNGAVSTNEVRCIGCRACTYSCPFGAVLVNPETGKTMSCDLCQGDENGPWCVRACGMQHALQYVDVLDAARVRGRSWAMVVKEEHAPPKQEGEAEFSFSFSV